MASSSIEFRKELFADERPEDLNEIGKPKQRQDALGHVTGRTAYFDDHKFEGLLHMRCVRSPHHHARIRSVNTSAAEIMPGVVRIVRPQDIPNNMNTMLSIIGFGRDDEALLQDKKVAYKGEPVIAIIGETELQVRNACKVVQVDYEVLPHVLDVEEALTPQAPVVNEEYPNNTFDYHDLYDHQKLRFGDVNGAFAKADHVIEGEYQMSPIEQAPMETCGAIAAPETNDRYVCYTSTQALFFSLGLSAKFLNVSSSRLHFIGGTVGGGFGGKVDSLHEPMAVLGSMLTGRPVKFMWDRAEEMQVGAPRGAERWRLKDGVMNDGRIVAREFTGFFDAGAYTRLSSYAIIKGTGHLPGPYSIPNVAANVYCVYTNRTPATAMRGFGITAVDFAIEAHMDKVAEAVRMNPIELRILNAYRDGEMKAHRRLAKNTALIECCQVAAQKGNWAIRPEFSAMSSLQGDSAKVDIPPTVVDHDGKIGDRKRGVINDAAPSKDGQVSDKPTSTVAPVTATQAMGEAAREPARVGADTMPSRVRSAEQESMPARDLPQPPAPTPAPPPAPAVPQQSAFAAPQNTPSDPPSTPVVPSTQQEPYTRGFKRPGTSPFVRGTRRR